jgi:hypothetical protein
LPHVWLTRRLRISWGLLTWAAIWLFGVANDSTHAQEAPRWKVGGAFTTQLQDSVDFEWRERPLRDGLARLSQAYGVAVFLDRRIDPDQPITVSIHEKALEESLRTIAREAKADLSVFGPVIYFGPPDAARNLATLAALRRQDAGKRNSDAKVRLLRSSALQWNELAQPRQLLEGLGKQAGVSFTNLDAIALDLWPAVSLPPLPWADRVTLVAVGFGMTFEIDERTISARLVPVPTSPHVENRYTPRGSAPELAAQLQRVMPDAQIRVEKDQLIVAARQEDHDKIQRLLTGQSVKTTKQTKPGGEKVYSLKVPNQPAGNVIQTIANSLGKQPRFSPAVAEKLRQNVTFEVNEMPLGYLLDTTLKPLGLTYRLGEDVLEIVEQP